MRALGADDAETGDSNGHANGDGAHDCGSIQSKGRLKHGLLLFGLP
jgi:hypothetical protein